MRVVCSSRPSSADWLRQWAAEALSICMSVCPCGPAAGKDGASLQSDFTSRVRAPVNADLPNTPIYITEYNARTGRYAEVQ